MNRLAVATSPYLLQHAENPVDWHEWGDEAFEQARLQDKPLLVSVGYSSCHWCHVMAHESFESEATAALMNELFVNVKVDREERPDVDAVTMEAAVGMTGSGGWPTTVFMTPDAKPFYAGTYFPPEPRHGIPELSRSCCAVSQRHGASGATTSNGRPHESTEPSGRRSSPSRRSSRSRRPSSRRRCGGSPRPSSLRSAVSAARRSSPQHPRSRCSFGAATTCR